MSERIKNNFYKWLKTLDSSLSEIDIKLLNIIINNFGELVNLGTAAGKRGKKLSELIIAQRETIASVLPELNIIDNTTKENIEKIIGFEVGPFKGFSTKEKFNFDKNYIFIYGPNGSGKSSFCESLEYALLGDIWEAKARNIDLDKYIKNCVTNKADLPLAFYRTSDGKVKTIQKSYNDFIFSFIEKNRIDGFARIASASPSIKKDRMAILFGFDAFSDFVDDFSDNIEKYLSIDTPLKNEFTKNSQDYEIKKTRLSEIEKEKRDNFSLFEALIKDVDNENINDKATLMFFLKGDGKKQGILDRLQTQKAATIPNDIETEIIKKYLLYISELKKSIDTINKEICEFNTHSSEVKYNDLYKVIISIEKDENTDKTICPACKTEIKNTFINPFENAHAEMEKLKKLSELQDNIPIKAQEISKQTRNIINNFKEIEIIINLIDNKNEYTCVKEFEYDNNVDSIFKSLVVLLNEVDKIIKDLTKYNELIQSSIDYNNKLANQRKELLNIDNEIKKYSNFNERLIELSAIEKKLNYEHIKTSEEIKQFEEKHKDLLKEIENEQKKVDVNQLYNNSYKNLIKELKNYKNQLPALLSVGLADKTKDYYNIINSHDPEFDKITNLSLPTSVDERINIIFSGSKEEFDALYILSEGHLKILGLSILLAKVVSEDLKIIIFDDIVNAIDDEHKSGVVDLLLGHADISKRQLIITSHGELFINKLESMLGASRASKDVISYRFCSMDSLTTREIKITGGETKNYLLRAIDAYNKDDKKEAAGKCRQAVENISQLLWKKLGLKYNINLTVKMRSPNSEPELSSVVASLIKEVEKIDKASDLYTKLKELQENYSWKLLNKGIHVEDEQEEFDKKDINKLIEIITIVDELVNRLKVPTELEFEEKKEEEIKYEFNQNEIKYNKNTKRSNNQGQLDLIFTEITN